MMIVRRMLLLALPIAFAACAPEHTEEMAESIAEEDAGAAEATQSLSLDTVEVGDTNGVQDTATANRTRNRQ